MKKILPFLGILLGLSLPLWFEAFAAPPPKPGKPSAEVADKKKPGKSTGKDKKTPPKKSAHKADDLVKDMKQATLALAKAAKEGGATPDKKDVPAAKPAKDVPGKKAPAKAAATKKPAKSKTHAVTLDPKKKQHVVFFSALKNLDAGIDSLTKALQAKDKGYFKALDETGKAVVQLQDAIRILRINDPAFVRPAKALAMSFNELRSNFSELALRKKKGGELTAEEKAQAKKLQAEIKKIQGELQEIHEKVAATKNKRLLAQIDELIIHAHRIDNIKAEATLAAFLELLDSLAFLEYEWLAFGEVVEFWYPEIYTVWKEDNAAFTVYFTIYDEDLLLVTVEDWAWIEVTVEVVDSMAFYQIELAEGDYATYESWVETYEESTATVSYSETEWSEETTDTEIYDAASFDMEDDDDGDGLTDDLDDDDDNDGTADDADTDDDNDGIADDDADGDGTPDDADDDDDNDGTSDEEDGDDDGDGVDDEEEDDVDADDDDGDEEEEEMDDDDGDDDGGDDDDGGNDDGGDDE